MENYFQNQFQYALAPNVDNIQELDIIFDVHLSSNIDDFDINELLRVIKSLQNDKTCGKNSIPAEFLKLPKILDIILPIINKALFHDGEVSLEWKSQLIIHIPNKGDLSLFYSS